MGAIVAEDKAKILYIEDDPASQLLVRRMLSFAGYRVLVAGRGIEGIDLALREVPDLILMDINLPDLSGREVTTRLRSDTRFRKTPIVALTSQSYEGEKEMALAAGLTGFLIKPMDIDRLPGQLAHYLRGGQDSADETALRNAQIAYSNEVVGRLETKIRELETMNRELQRLDQVKDNFIEMTSHELRTPLTLISGYSHLLQDSDVINALRNQSPEVKQFIDGLVESIDRMTQIISEILTIARISTDRIELTINTIPLGELLSETVTEYRAAIQRRNLACTFDPAGWPTIRADRDLIALCFRNLMSNAIKYTPDGGTITISYQQEANGVTVVISDTGIGVRREDQSHIFDRFVTTNSPQNHSTSKTNFKGGGLGIGLAICKGIVDAHKGRIWVESAGHDEGHPPGSRFYVHLPLDTRTPEMISTRRA
jgi:signal transduction histidine kinase